MVHRASTCGSWWGSTRTPTSLDKRWIKIGNWSASTHRGLMYLLCHNSSPINCVVARMLANSTTRSKVITLSVNLSLMPMDDRTQKLGLEWKVGFNDLINLVCDLCRIKILVTYLASYPLKYLSFWPNSLLVHPFSHIYNSIIVLYSGKRYPVARPELNPSNGLL